MIKTLYKPVDLEDLLGYHHSVHQILEFQDIYKMLYQGVFGAEHLLQNKQRAFEALRLEWKELKENKQESLLEPLSLTHEYVRLNLRPVKSAGMPLDRVWTLFVNTPQGNHSMLLFKKRLQDFYALTKAGKINYNAEKWLDYCEQQRNHNYPATHHSKAYKNNNHPAYRVIRTLNLFRED
jgi:hypothetical protein